MSAYGFARYPETPADQAVYHARRLAELAAMRTDPAYAIPAEDAFGPLEPTPEPAAPSCRECGDELVGDRWSGFGCPTCAGNASWRYA